MQVCPKSASESCELPSNSRRKGSKARLVIRCEEVLT